MASTSIKIKSILKSTQFGTYLRRRRWNKSILSKERARKAVETHFTTIENSDKERIIADILDMAKKYRFSPEEYFYYHFLEKGEEERKSFISDLNRIDFCERLNKAKNLSIFDDKQRSAEVFKKYYHRDVCDVTVMKDLEKLKAFVQKHRKFILKPLFGTCGQGVEILELQGTDDELKQLIKKHCAAKSDGFIVEELIVQHPETAKYHPSSVNTVRIATILYDDGPTVWASFFRTGRSGNIVDNAGAGGVFGTIDPESGVILAVADELGNSYTHHPDTNVPMVGAVIPQWNEAKAMAKELATVVKGNRYAGWDLALTDHGWVMVEGNARGQFVWQIPTQKGFMDEVQLTLRKLNLPEMKKLGTE